jgi:DNA-binding NarL/FixJ family response regulator
LLGAAKGAMDAAHTALEPQDARPLRDTEAALASELGAQLPAAEARGRALSEPEVERLVAQIFDPGPHPTEAPLTRRELEVVRLMAAGLTNGEIAARLVLSDHTVHRHVANILGKLDVPSRAAAASVAAQQGLL